MNTQDKLILEPVNVEELLRGWLIHAHKARDRHDKAARHLDLWRAWLGGIAATFAAVVGTSVFAALKAPTTSTTIQAIVSTVAVVSAILTGLSAFLNLSERVDKHRFSGVRYKEVIRELERLLSAPADKLEKSDPAVTSIRDRLDQFEESAPVVPERLYDLVENEWRERPFRFVDKAEDLYKK